MGRVSRFSMDKLARGILGKKALNGVSAKPNAASKLAGSKQKNDTATGALEDAPVRNRTCLQKSNSMPNLKNSRSNESLFRPLSMGSTQNGARPSQGSDVLDALLNRYQTLKDSSTHLIHPSMTSEQLDAELRQRLAALKNPSNRRGSSLDASDGSDSSFSTAESSFGSRRVGGSLSRAKTSMKDLDWYERQQLNYAKYGLILGGVACVFGLAIGVTQVAQAATD